MGLSDWIELLVVLYTNVCMPLCCSFRAQRHDGQHGCLTTAASSRVNVILDDKTELPDYVYLVTSSMPTATSSASHLHLGQCGADSRAHREPPLFQA
jgi:hypothetical protein